MNTLIKYFGMIAEQLEKNSEIIFIEAENQSIDLQDFFEKKHPQLKGMSYKIAVDQEFMTHLDLSTEIKEIALLPPFAGG